MTYAPSRPKQGPPPRGGSDPHTVGERGGTKLMGFEMLAVLELVDGAAVRALGLAGVGHV